MYKTLNMQSDKNFGHEDAKNKLTLEIERGGASSRPMTSNPNQRKNASRLGNMRFNKHMSRTFHTVKSNLTGNPTKIDLKSTKERNIMGQKANYASNLFSSIEDSKGDLSQKAQRVNYNAILLYHQKQYSLKNERREL